MPDNNLATITVNAELLADLDLDSFELPESFLFGVCNSPYHSEGGYNTEAGPHNNWSSWEQKGFTEVSGATNRFWDDWQPHIDKAKSAGLNVFRMGIDWSRLQPSASSDEAPEPAWDVSAFDRYAEIIGAVYDAGMEPVITLHHFTHPAWLGAHLWTAEKKVGLFLTFVERATTEVNARLAAAGHRAIPYYVVFNEPYNTLAGPYLFGDAPPGDIKNDVVAFGRATVNLLWAYVKTYDLIHDLYEARAWQRPQVGFNIVSYAIFELDKWYLDLVRAPSRGIGRDAVKAYLETKSVAFYNVIAPLAKARLTPQQLAYWQGAASDNRDMYAGFSLDKLLNALYDSPRQDKLDYVAIDCYDPFILATLGEENEGYQVESVLGGDRFDWTKLTFNPDVTREHLRLHSRDLDDLPFYILETTIGHNHKKGGVPEPRPDGVTVQIFLGRMFAEVVRLLNEGVPLRGFLYWTLCDNYEWGSYTSRLGLLEYDYKTHQLKDTDAFGAANLDTYKTLISALRSENPERIRQALAATASGKELI